MIFKLPSDPTDRFDVHFPQDKSFDLVGFGVNAVDRLCVVPRYPGFDSKTEILHYERLAGGQTATAVVFVSRLGLKAKYVGKVGSDEKGRFSLSDLQSESVDTSSVLVAGGTCNQHSVIIVDKDSGERTILWQRSKGLNFTEGELKKEHVCAGRILLLDGRDHDASLRAAGWAEEEGIPVVMDLDKVVPGIIELAGKADFLIASANFPQELTSIADPVESLLALRPHCRGFLAVTLGARGAMAALGDRCVLFPALETPITDTTGAGDVFHGGFIFGLLQNWPLGKIMAFANTAAALNCGRLGARAGLPSLAEILNRMQAP